jgi:two-component system, NtrC family, sensor kinase
MARLCLLDENGAMAKQWELGESPLAIGRADIADVVINDDSLSRRHFEIVRQGTDFLLTDLNSQNGTWVDGKPAQTTKLRHHDCILAGRTLFLFDGQKRPSKASAGAVRQG